MALVTGCDLIVQISLRIRKEIVHIDIEGICAISQRLHTAAHLCQILGRIIGSLRRFFGANGHDTLQNELSLRLSRAQLLIKLLILLFKSTQIRPRFVEAQIDEDLVILFTFQQLGKGKVRKAVVRQDLAFVIENTHTHIAEIVGIAVAIPHLQSRGAGIPNEQRIIKP